MIEKLYVIVADNNGTEGICAHSAEEPGGGLYLQAVTSRRHLIAPMLRAVSESLQATGKGHLPLKVLEFSGRLNITEEIEHE